GPTRWPAGAGSLRTQKGQPGEVGEQGSPRCGAEAPPVRTAVRFFHRFVSRRAKDSSYPVGLAGGTFSRRPGLGGGGGGGPFVSRIVSRTRGNGGVRGGRKRGSPSAGRGRHANRREPPPPCGTGRPGRRGAGPCLRGRGRQELPVRVALTTRALAALG